MNVNKNRLQHQNNMMDASDGMRDAVLGWGTIFNWTIGSIFALKGVSKSLIVVTICFL